MTTPPKPSADLTDPSAKRTPDEAGALDLLNCGGSGRVHFTAPCPVGWENLQETADRRRRWCGGCERSVFLCHDANETAIRAEQGECVAVPAWLAEGVRQRREGVLIVGRPSLRGLFSAVVQERLDAARAPADASMIGYIPREKEGR